MIGSIARSVGAVVVGFIPAMILIIGVEVISDRLYPFPPGVDPHDMEVCRSHVAKLPAGIFLTAVVGWGMGTFLTSWLATRLGTGRHPVHGIVVGSFLFLGAVMNMLMLPYPIWFWGLNLVVLPGSIVFGVRQGRVRPSGTPAPIHVSESRSEAD